MYTGFQFEIINSGLKNKACDIIILYDSIEDFDAYKAIKNIQEIAQLLERSARLASVGVIAGGITRYDPFFTTKPPSEGSGLGLAISKMFLEKYNATISAHNNEHGGATFKLIFDIAQTKK